ncbi:hypothetical protein [Microbacterium lacticum]|uniref:FMN-binding protein n=1 Tax=Microbacterium lacticum TaxID=33885 RepID=A0A4Y3UKU8_9MICO|nr:hypothetical protein [Microbacterium lacticum]TQN00953.1 hypothetical protein FHX68_1084 [Microbacterium lacticum]GEB94317.1 hypothetical protein MLA01_05360 [Microbacterium lacticum]GGN17405.1 hypothetical protein GCM10009724_08960 [Microbacterium lacticum]
MIRTTAVARPRMTPVRTGFAAASVLGVAVLAGCSGTAEADATADTTPSPTTSASATPSTTPSATASETAAAPATTYVDGTYTADGTYVDGGGVAETVTVTISLAGDVVTAVDVTGDAASPQSRQYQQVFIGGIAGEVVGKDIDDLSVSRVAGSSLTSGGFNDALETIKADARA